MKRLPIALVLLATLCMCTKESTVDHDEFGNKFKEIRSVKFTVPSDYDHDHQIEKFMKNMGWWTPTTTFWTDQTFSSTTDELIPGRSYTVKVYDVERPFGGQVYFQDCINFMGKNKALFVSFQGLSLLFMVNPSALENGMDFEQYMSLDPNLPKASGISGGRSIPRIYRSQGSWNIDIENSNYAYWTSAHLVVFYD